MTLTQTWNTTGVCAAIKATITDTASDATSLLIDMIVGATSVFKVSKTGSIQGKGVLVMGSGDVQLTQADGRIQAISTTYFGSLSGANLTGLNATELTTGTVPVARIPTGIPWASVDKAGSSLADLATRASANLSDAANIPLLNASQAFTGTCTFTLLKSVVAREKTAVTGNSGNFTAADNVYPGSNGAGIAGYLEVQLSTGVSAYIPFLTA
jgi:hypothetical protein